MSFLLSIVRGRQTLLSFSGNAGNDLFMIALGYTEDDIIFRGPMCGVHSDPSPKSWGTGEELFIVSGVRIAAASRCLLSTTSWSCSWAIRFCISSRSLASATDTGVECPKEVREGVWYCCWGYMGNGESRGTGDSY